MFHCITRWTWKQNLLNTDSYLPTLYSCFVPLRGSKHPHCGQHCPGTCIGLEQLFSGQIIRSQTLLPINPQRQPRIQGSLSSTIINSPVYIQKGIFYILSCLQVFNIFCSFKWCAFIGRLQPPEPELSKNEVMELFITAKVAQCNH